MRTEKLIFAFCLSTSLLLSACGGGGGGGGGDGGGGNPPPPPDPVTTDIADVAVDEGDSGTAEAVFTVTLSETTSDDVTVDYATADGSALGGSDYTAVNGTLTVPAGDVQATIVVDILGDTGLEADETFSVTLRNPSANAVLGVAAATGRINNDDTAAQSTATGLNDTGVVDCSTEIADDLSCNDPISGSDEFPRQDAEYGRDFTADDNSDGRAGFAFVKLDASGVPLPDQTASYASSTWECVEDTVTGLVWEVKSDDSGSPQAQDATYSWRNTSGINDGGDQGLADGGNCPQPGGCDTEAYIAAINAAGVCGITTWRLPTRGELLSLVDYGAAAPPMIDVDYFPNAIASSLWTAEPDARSDVRTVDFASGESRGHRRTTARSVRLVSSGGVQ